MPESFSRARITPIVRSHGLCVAPSSAGRLFALCEARSLTVHPGRGSPSKKDIVWRCSPPQVHCLGRRCSRMNLPQCSAEFGCWELGNNRSLPPSTRRAGTARARKCGECRPIFTPTTLWMLEVFSAQVPREQLRIYPARCHLLRLSRQPTRRCIASDVINCSRSTNLPIAQHAPRTGAGTASCNVCSVLRLRSRIRCRNPGVEC